MEKSLRRMILLAAIVFTSMMSVTVVEAKTVKKTVVLLEDTTRKVSMDSTDITSLKVSGKKYVSVKAKDYYVKITGKKPGKAEISFKIPELNKKYKINVTVLSLKKTKKTANAQLNKYLKKLKKGTAYMYTDLNKDGIRELCLKNKFVYYDYQKKKLRRVKHNFSDIYTSKKSKKIYGILREQKKTEEFVYFSGLFEPDATKIFGLTDLGHGFRMYTEVGKVNYGVENPYAFYDNYYDQDDYEYEDLTQEEMEKCINKLIPQAVKLKWKKK